MKHFVLPITALIMGVSIIIAAIILKDTPSNAKPNESITIQTPTMTNPNLMTKKQLASYLQIKEGSIDKIIEQDQVKRAEMGDGVFDTYMFLPYLKIDNQERFLKSEIDKWLQYKNDSSDKNDNLPQP